MDEIQGFRKLQRNETMRNSPMWTGGFGGQPMRGTIEAKVIRHAFSTYPRINLGNSTATLAIDDMERTDSQYDKDAALAAVMAGAHDDDDAPAVHSPEDDTYNQYTENDDEQQEDDQTTQDTEQAKKQNEDPWAPPTTPVETKAKTTAQQQQPAPTKPAVPKMDF
jgi:hypothetical protein